MSPKKKKKFNWRSQLHAQRSKLHSNPWDHQKKNSFFEKYKESAICAILTEKSHFGAYPVAKNDVVRAQVR